MNPSLRIACIGALFAVSALSACAWDRGEYRGHRDGSRGQYRGSEQQRNGHDRQGRPCDDHGRGDDGRHDEDCRPRNY